MAVPKSTRQTRCRTTPPSNSSLLETSIRPSISSKQLSWLTKQHLALQLEEMHLANHTNSRFRYTELARTELQYQEPSTKSLRKEVAQ